MPTIAARKIPGSNKSAGLWRESHDRNWKFCAMAVEPGSCMLLSPMRESMEAEYLAFVQNIIIYRYKFIQRSRAGINAPCRRSTRPEDPIEWTLARRTFLSPKSSCLCVEATEQTARTRPGSTGQAPGRVYPVAQTKRHKATKIAVFPVLPDNIR